MDYEECQGTGGLMINPQIMKLLAQTPGHGEPDKKKLWKLIDKAKMALMLREGTTFFSALLANLKLIMDESRPTAATNGINIWLNPYFLQMQTPEKILGLLLHELFHVVFDHVNFILYKHLNQKVLGIAQDHYINLYILSMGYELPDGGYADPIYKGMSSMEIYHELMKDPPPEANDIVLDVEGKPDDMSETEHQETITSNLVKAVMQAQMAKDAGSIPGHIMQKLDEVLNPRLPWNVILMNYMDMYAKNDYSWSRPNKRFMPEFYLPNMQSERLQQITGGLDVSGSMTGDDLSECMAEYRYIWDMLKPESMRLMTFDTKVHLNHMFEEGDELPDATLEGGGGTNVVPLLESIKRECPVFALIFTDGYFAEPDMEGITSDIFWIIKGNPGFTAPKGEVIHFGD